MAMTKCRECGREISDEAAACPGCGVKRSETHGCLPIVVIGLIAFGAIKAFEKPSPPPVPKTPEQVASDQRKERAFQKVVLTLKTIKASMRNPDSLVWESIGAADGDADIVCVTYRAQNGFGGMNKEFAVYVNGKPYQTAKAWNDHCLGALDNMIHARQALR